MIPAIDPGIGLKEDFQVPKAPPVGNKDFATALHRAEEQTRTSTSRRTENRPPPGDPRVRSKYGEEQDRAMAAAGPPKTEQSDPVKEEQDQADTEGVEDNALDSSSGKVANPHLKRADETLPIEDSLMEGAEGLSVSFTDMGEDGMVGNIQDQTPINAQIGSAVWRLSRHGNQEAQFGADSGVILPGSVEAELAQAGNLDQTRGDILEAVEKAPDSEKQVFTRTEELQDLLNVSDEAKGKTRGKGLSANDQIKLDAAQARNQLLGQLVAGQDQALNQGLETEQAQNFLRERLQMEGVFSKSARALTQNLSDADAATNLAAPAPGVGVVNPAHIFETPVDEAVQQRVVEQVASEARWMITNNRNQVTLRLHPEHLGDVNLKVVQEDGGIMRIELKVDSLAAKSLLENHMSELRDKLAADNLASDFRFDVNVRKDHQQPDLQARDQDRPTFHSNRMGSLEMATAAGSPRRVLNQSGLSIYA